jgi:hypothetical protein
MAKHKPGQSSDGPFLSNVIESWASELCAEHDGSVADFTALDRRLTELDQYRELLRRRKSNLYAVARAGGGILAGAAVFCPITYFAAPGFAAVLGATGLLGAASTGTAIVTLQGAALASASLAAIGPGGVVGGAVLITAAGASLGGKAGAVVTNNYFGEVEDFKIIKVRDGTGPAIVLINGLLSQKKQNADDWLSGISLQYPNNPCYLVTWESAAMSYFGNIAASSGGPMAIKKVVEELISRQGRTLRQKANPLVWASVVTQIFGNRWHGSMVKASMTGLILADLLARTDHKEGFILMGHSLGARVIYYMLEALSTTKNANINDVYLLGGAVGLDNSPDWDAAVSAVSGNIFNVYSTRDDVLRYLYQGANAFLSRPIGLGPIRSSSSKLKNLDASSIVDSHMNYKNSLESVMQAIHQSPVHPISNA